MFPIFNLYGTSLLLLTAQGLLFAFLLIRRVRSEGRFSDLFLALVLLITCYHQTTYTLGFMDWYDTFRTTKINYYLPDLSLALAPLIYYYIRSVVSPSFSISDVRFWHFVPIFCYLGFKVFVLIYDSAQPGFDEVQNGELVVSLEWKYINPFVFLLKTCQMLLYLAFSFQLLYAFREKIKHYFANTYKLELNWLQNFLIVYSFLYLFNITQTVINDMIIDLSWIQKWWYYLLSGFSIIYVGVHGYFARLTQLQNVDFSTFRLDPDSNPPTRSVSDDLIGKRCATIQAFMKEQKPYLDPDLSLISLAQRVGVSREELSDTINQGMDLRFNDFVNGYRVDETKRLIMDGKYKSHSLLGLAFEAGFNSKATFNRAFKKAENQSPSQYLETLIKSD